MERKRNDPNEIIVEDDICRMKLYNNKCEEVAETIFDLKYKSEIEKYKWHLQKGYVATDWFDENDKHVQMCLHQAIIQISGQEVPEGYEIDHKDTIKLNNLEENLRVCTRYQNQHNRTKQRNNTSGYKGITWQEQSKKWRAQIRVNNKKIFLGLFEKDLDAAQAYNNAALQYHGEFAQINPISTGV